MEHVTIIACESSAKPDRPDLFKLFDKVCARIAYSHVQMTYTDPEAGGG